MNWQHLQAIVWLRWRLLVNQWRRAGVVNGVLMMIISIGALVTAVPLFIASLILGLYLIPKAEPVHLMYVWDGLVVVLLFFWMIGLITDLQRSEPLSLSKIMHLPVSANGAFLINYLSSLIRLSLLVFGPVMLGFCVALVIVKGLYLLPALPLVAAFLLMISALTYQFQGWLGSLMSNPRRRRTVVVVTTATFVLIAQLPNLLNLYAPWGAQRLADQSTNLVEEMAKLNREFQARESDAMNDVRQKIEQGSARDSDFVQRQIDRRLELARRQEELMEKHELARKEAFHASAERWGRMARLGNMVLPIGWLPLGVMAAAEGNLVPSILGLLGMTLIGTASLWQAYRTTIGQYQGQSTNRKGRRAPAAPSPTTVRRSGGMLLETHLPGVSEPVSAVALGGLRSLLRSPEAKMMLLTPIIMDVIFGSMLLRGRHAIPESFRPLVAIGAMIFVLFGMLQLMGNQFGFDRDGFRVFVLSAARRRDILLGKNLAFAPLALGMGAVLLVIVQIVCPMRLEHFVGMVPQYLSMYLLFCIFTNFFSIYAPVYIAAGSMKPSNPKLMIVFLQIVMFMFLFPLTQGVMLLPWGIAAVLELSGWVQDVPVFLILSVLTCAAVVFLYRLSLVWQGSLLQAREQSILETVTSRAA